MKTKENDFEKLARLIKEEGEDIRSELSGKIDTLEKKMDIGFAEVNRRLDRAVQPQLDEHAHRIKELETAVFSK